MAKKQAIKFNFTKALDLIEALDKNKEKAVETAIRKASTPVQIELYKFFSIRGEHWRKNSKHKVQESLIKRPVVTNDGGLIESKLGYRRNKGGYVAYFYNYGTPRIEPTRFINKAFRKTKASKILNAELQKFLESGGKSV